MRKAKTKAEIIEISKKYSTLREFTLNDKSAYTIAAKNGWIDEFTWLERKNKKWNQTTCEEEAKKYKTLREFKKFSSIAYSVANTNGWLASYTHFEEPVKPKDNSKLRCYNIAKKYNTYLEFRKSEHNAFATASFNGWLKDYTWLKKLKRGQKVIPEGFLSQE